VGEIQDPLRVTVRRKYILFHAVSATDHIFFGEGARDNCNEPIIALKRRCKQLGYILEVAKNQSIEECEWLIFWDVPSIGPVQPWDSWLFDLKNRIRNRPFRNLYHEAIQAGLQDRMVLILAEPPSVYPRNLDTSLHKAFRIVFTWDRGLVDGVKYIHALLPVTAVFPEVPAIPFVERKMLVDISANKYSTHERELYTERRNAIKFFEEHFSAAFELYGIGWNVTKQGRIRSLFNKLRTDEHFYSSYRGIVGHKSQVIPRFKYVICYENIAGQTDYISNRIFDVLRCHSVPIYLGAPNITDYVDKEAFIDRHEFGSNQELARYISSISEKEYQKMIDAGRAYLDSPKFKQFLSDKWVDLVISTLNLKRECL
jgi:hypothetical protein